MQDELHQLLQAHECLQDKETLSNGTIRYSLLIPPLPEERSIEDAWIEIPKDFPDPSTARIKLPEKYILKIPHVESGGHLCIDGDPGPLSGGSPCERINQLIDSFYMSFIEPWSRGELDEHFITEAMNYWGVYCARHLSEHQPIFKIYTTNARPKSPKVYKSIFLEHRRIVIAGENSTLRTRYIHSLSSGAKQTNIITAEIPIAFPFTPENWPKTLGDIQRIVSARLSSADSNLFFNSMGRRERKTHRIVIFKASGSSFGYLLPGGPPTIIHRHRSIKSYPSNSLLPLEVERLDVSWTTGRDQHPEYQSRQKKHVLVIGAGALGSPTIEQLAKSGVGRLSIIDGETLDTSNIGRHVLGADSIGKSKAKKVAESVSMRWASCDAKGLNTTIQVWLKTHQLKEADLILDLTGEPEVRDLIDKERKKHSVDLIIAWMEPYVAAAHTCILPAGSPWKIGDCDKLESLNSVDWPDEVMMNEPACSSRFQSYTPTAATHAVALTAEAALDLLDQKIPAPTVRHWVRGQQYLDKCHQGLRLRKWAQQATEFDGIVLQKNYE